MMEAYGKALYEERLRPRRHAEIAAYVRSEYGPGIGPGFLLAAMDGGAARQPRRNRDSPFAGLLRGLAKAVKAFAPSQRTVLETTKPNPTK